MSNLLNEKKQFYLTWSYLRKFTENPNDNKRDSKIYVLNRWSSESTKVKSETLCYDKFDYSSSSDIKSDELMKLTEIPFNHIIRQFDETKNIGKNDLYVLIKLIVFMHTRTTSYVENIAVLENKDLEYINELVRKNYKILYAQHLLTYPRLATEKLLNLDISKFSKRFRITDPIDPRWKMALIDHGKDVFITSDNPVLFFSLNPSTSPISPLMILTISPSKLLVSYFSDYFDLNSKPTLDGHTIEFINKRLYQRSNQAIYSNTRLKGKQIEQLSKEEDFIKYDKLNIKKFGINLQVDELPKRGFSFLKPK